MTAIELVKTKFKTEVDRLSQLFGRDLSDVKFEFIQRRRFIGQTDTLNRIVRINSDYLMDEKNIRHVLNDTICHELCHIVERMIYGKSSHSPDWKNLMRRAGVAPNRCATVDQVVVVKTVKIVKVVCAKCKYVYNLSQRRATMIKNRTTRFLVCKCGHDLSKPYTK